MGVYKEGKNWKVQVYYKDWKGNRKRKQKRGFRTKGEAKEWERDFLQQQSQGVDIEFGNFLEIYYKDMDVRLRESTMSMKRYIIELKIRPYFEKKVLSEITVADIRAWQNELLSYKDKNGKGYAPTYLKTINCQLTAIFNYAIRYYNLPGNPCKKAGAIGKSKGEPKDFWMQDEFNEFLKTVEDKPDARLAFLVLYWTGMRIGELLSLKAGSLVLDEEAKLLACHFERSKSDQLGVGVTSYISISPGINDPVAYIDVLSGLQPTDKICPWSQKTLTSRLRARLSTIGVDAQRFSWHSFRRGAAFLASKKGIQDCVIKKHGRWKSDAYLRYVAVSAVRAGTEIRAALTE